VNGSKREAGQQTVDNRRRTTDNGCGGNVVMCPESFRECWYDDTYNFTNFITLVCLNT